MGSGTTAVACNQLGRRFIGFEISAEYYQIAKNRLNQESLLQHTLIT
jgi:site-specific DNA-methyltransferase (adenine-specific)